MALIHGDGTQNNPYIVDNWTDFQTYNISGNTAKYVQFASPHKNYETGVITLEGAGTRVYTFLFLRNCMLFHV